MLKNFAEKKENSETRANFATFAQEIVGTSNKEDFKNLKKMFCKCAFICNVDM